MNRLHDSVLLHSTNPGEVHELMREVTFKVKIINVPLPTTDAPAPCGFPPSDTCLLCISFSDRLKRKSGEVSDELGPDTVQIPNTVECIPVKHGIIVVKNV